MVRTATIGPQWEDRDTTTGCENKGEVLKCCMRIRYSVCSFVIMNLSLQPLESVLQ